MLYIKIYANFINIAEQFALNAALAKSIKYLINHYLIFSAKKFIYDTAVNYSVF